MSIKKGDNTLTLLAPEDMTADETFEAMAWLSLAMANQLKRQNYVPIRNSLKATIESYDKTADHYHKTRIESFWNPEPRARADNA